MKKTAAIIGVLVLAGILYFYAFFPKEKQKEANQEYAALHTAPHSVEVESSKTRNSPTSSEATNLAKKRDTVKQLTDQRMKDLERAGWAVDVIDGFGYRITGLHSVLNRYFDTFGRYPDNGAQAIQEALTGNNPESKQFVTKTKGKQLVTDQYGQPLLFTFGSKKNECQIRSAGRDRLFNTDDDQVVDWYADVDDGNVR